MVCGLIGMYSDFEIIRLPDYTVQVNQERKTPNHIIAEIFNVSKQGKSKSQGSEKWKIPGKIVSNLKIIMDSELRNIWAFKNGSAFCLRAGGVDQELIDFNDFSYPNNTKDQYFVRETGKGTSQLCIVYREGKITEINYDDSGYQSEEFSLADVVKSRTIEKNWRQGRLLEPKGWKPGADQWKNSIADCRMQHPNTTSWQVGKFELSDPDESIYIDWSFEDGLVEDEDGLVGDTGSPSEEMLNDKLEPIELPGGFQAFHASVNSNTFEFTNNAVAFGKKVLGIRPFGNNPPETRFPRTSQELKFEAGTKMKISVLEGEIEELKGMFRDHVRSHD